MANNFPEDSTGFDCGRARLHCGIFLGLRLPEVEIQIGSRAHARSIGWTRRRLIRVAILGSDTFDVSDVNVGSLAFGPNGASPWRHGRRGRPLARRRDVNGDGLLDLLSYYRLRETGLTRHDRDACLVGKLNDAWSRPFEACDQLARPMPRNSHRR